MMPEPSFFDMPLWENPLASWRCRYCKKEFIADRDLIRHILRVHIAEKELKE